MACSDKGKLLILSTADWDEPNWTNKQHVATGFLKRGYYVLYVEPPIYFGRFLLNWFRGLKGQDWKRKLIPIRNERTGLFVISQFYFFPARFWKFNYLLGTIMNSIWIGFVLFLLGFYSPKLLNYLPYGDRYYGLLTYSSSLYDCVDEYSGMDRIIPGIEDLEKRTIKTSDAVSVTARGLLERKRPFNPRTYVVHNVGNSELFLQSHIGEVANEMKRFSQKKVLGFIGAVNFKIDLDIIELLASDPENEIVFIGPVYDIDSGRIENLKNVHLMGTRPLEILPKYVKGFDVGIIPYKINKYTKYVFPLKLFEFFAAGIPVVSTPLPEIEYYRDLVFLSSTPEGFLNQCSSLPGKFYADKRSECIDLARKNNWDTRVKRLEELLCEEA